MYFRFNDSASPATCTRDSDTFLGASTAYGFSCSYSSSSSAYEVVVCNSTGLYIRRCSDSLCSQDCSDEPVDTIPYGCSGSGVFVELVCLDIAPITSAPVSAPIGAPVASSTPVATPQGVSAPSGTAGPVAAIPVSVPVAANVPVAAPKVSTPTAPKSPTSSASPTNVIVPAVAGLIMMLAMILM
jgi:hypothetical protein